ncbi:MAG: M23 family metallopeptidase [Clostridia bacterium]|nr:M23 family metallopeptidase [Clostridia bacterium]
MNMKKIIVSILCVAALFIPTYLAIASYVINRDAPINTQGVDRIEIADPDGEIFKVAAAETGNDMISLFNEINETGTKRDELPAQLVGKPFYKVTYITGKKTVDYKYYFSTDTQNCYYMDDMGATYHIQAEHAAKFISTPYAASLYEEAKAPVLNTLDGSAILPSAIVWNYRTADGNFHSRTGLVTDTTVPTYDMDGGIAFDFDVKPDILTVKAYDGETLVYDGNYESLSNLDVSESKLLAFQLDASWYEDSTRGYHGTASYQFKANVVAPAEFYLGRSEVEPGEFVVLSGINVADISKISFSSEPSINYTPTFFADGKYVHALIPISYDLEETDAYTFTVSYGITKQTINLTVKDKIFGLHNYDISKAIIDSCRTAATLSAYEAIAAPLNQSADPTRYFDGKFLDYSESPTKWIIVTGIGRFRTLTATGETYRHTGVDFYAQAGVDVPAVNNGRVVYVGATSLTGKLVVIEHGYGLKSWYGHLSETTVSVGDTVTTGQTIGKTGNTGFINFNGVHMGLTVYGVPVSPYPLWANGIEMYFDK